MDIFIYNYLILSKPTYIPIRHRSVALICRIRGATYKR